jgi:hypothetical protein
MYKNNIYILLWELLFISSSPLGLFPTYIQPQYFLWIYPEQVVAELTQVILGCWLESSLFLYSSRVAENCDSSPNQWLDSLQHRLQLRAISWITKNTAQPDRVKGFLRAALASTLWLMSDHGAQLGWKGQLRNNPNPPCQHSLWEEIWVLRRSPCMAFGRALTDSFTQVSRVLIENQTHELRGESRLLWWSRTLKPLWYRIVSINPKTNWRNHCAFDEAPWWFNIKTHQREFRFVFHCTKICSYVSWYSRDFIPMKLLDNKWLITMSMNEFILKLASIR